MQLSSENTDKLFVLIILFGYGQDSDSVALDFPLKRFSRYFVLVDQFLLLDCDLESYFILVVTCLKLESKVCLWNVSMLISYFSPVWTTNWDSEYMPRSLSRYPLVTCLFMQFMQVRVRALMVFSQWQANLCTFWFDKDIKVYLEGPLVVILMLFVKKLKNYWQIPKLKTYLVWIHLLNLLIEHTWR